MTNEQRAHVALQLLDTTQVPFRHLAPALETKLWLESLRDGSDANASSPVGGFRGPAPGAAGSNHAE